MAGWRHFQHMADIGVHGFGDSLEEAFEQAALGLTGVITEPSSVHPITRVEVTCAAPDRELLLVDWLNAWVYQMATRHMLFGRFQVRLRADGLIGSGWGEPVARERHQPAVEVKGATYTALRVWQDAEASWHAQCVVDV